MGVNLNLSDRYGVNVLWAGSSGLRFEFVINLCQALKNCYFSMGIPTLLYVCTWLSMRGGNDIGRIPTGSLRKCISAVLTYLKVLLPGTVIVWSCILPRIKWRHSDNHGRCQGSNKQGGYTVCGFRGGRAIKHPDFQDKHPALFSDNTHLSFIGIDIFLNSFQGAFETFLYYPNVKVYPVE